MSELLPKDPSKSGLYWVLYEGADWVGMAWNADAHAWEMANGSRIGPIDMGGNSATQTPATSPHQTKKRNCLTI